MIAASKQSDFADWLSPMLVKELRQGMRSKVFMAAFYVTHVLMIVYVLLSLIVASNADMLIPMGSFLRGLFWFMIGIPLLIVMPIRGFGALHGELKAGTLELIFLTHMSAFRIVAGKWLALMVQTLLLLCSVLPYVVLRYFLGGVNVIDDLQTVFFLLAASATCSAITMALSPYESKVLRALFVLAIIFSVMFLPMMLSIFLAAATYSGRGTGPALTLSMGYAGMLLFLPAFLLLALEMAASKIAPPAENHALRKRLTGIYFLVAATGLAVMGAAPAWVYGVAMAMLFFVIIDAMSEPQQPVRRVYQPYLRMGPAGRALAALFTPGWASATWYVACLGLLSAALLQWHGQLRDENLRLQYLAYFGALVFPAALIRLFKPSTGNFLGFYITLQILFVFLTILLNITFQSIPEARVWFSILPSAVFATNLVGQIRSPEMPEVLAATLVMVSLSMGVLMLRSITPWRDIFRMLRQAPDSDVQR